MKAIYFCLLIMAVLLVFACSSNKQVEVPQVQQEVPKTPAQLAVEKAADAKDAYENKDYQGAINQYQEALALFEQAAPTAAVEDSIPRKMYSIRMNIAQIHSIYGLEQYQLNTPAGYQTALAEFQTTMDMYNQLLPTAPASDSLNVKIGNLYRYMAYAARETGNYQLALQYLDSYQAFAPNDVSVINDKYQIYKDNLKDENMATQNLILFANSVTDVNNKFSAAHKLGDVYSEKQDYANAALWYEKALSLKNDPNVIKKLGSTYRSMKQYAKSSEYYERYLATNPSVDEMKTLYKILADNYKQAKNNAKSIEYFEKYLSLEYNQDIALYVTNYYYGIKNYTKTISNATKLINTYPGNTTAILLRGMAYYYLKDMKNAKADFERIQNDPKNGENAKSFLKTMK